jgi:hypothetical protein
MSAGPTGNRPVRSGPFFGETESIATLVESGSAPERAGAQSSWLPWPCFWWPRPRPIGPWVWPPAAAG